MTEARLVIRNDMGLHVRASSKLAKMASRFKANVFVSYDDVEVNAKSILGILMLAAEEGSVITVRADGIDEVQAIQALKKLVDGKFEGEP